MSARFPAIFSLHASQFLGSDIYRLSVSVEGSGWSAQLQDALGAVRFGGSIIVPIWVSRQPGSAASAKVTMKAQSESDPTKTAAAVVQMTGSPLKK